MKQVIPEIYVSDCKHALAFYKDVFGGEIKNLQMSDQLELFKDKKGKVIHSELHVNSRCVFYFVDILNQKRARSGNITVMVHMNSMDEIQHAYNGLLDGGRVGMKLQETFSGEFHAIVTDRYGAPWALNYARS